MRVLIVCCLSERVCSFIFFAEAFKLSDCSFKKEYMALEKEV